MPELTLELAETLLALYEGRHPRALPMRIVNELWHLECIEFSEGTAWPPHLTAKGLALIDEARVLLSKKRLKG